MTAVRLGLQLALTRSGRLRTALLVLAATIAAAALLVIVAASRFELTHASSYQAEMPRIVGAAVAAVALPCLVLLATVARLSAALRDRRLANLRLIGLTPGQTRLVATAETGVAAALGSLLGWLAFWAARPLLVDHPLGGRHWDAAFAPHAVDQAAVLLVVPAAVVLAALAPTRTTTRTPLALTRRADRTPPGWWRLAPLLLGAALCGAAIVHHGPTEEDSDLEITLFFVGTVLLGTGLVLVLPVLVRLLTRALTGRRLGPAARIAVRRLEAQPAAVARIVGALLVGLFLVTGARYVLVAFESTPQYVATAHSLTVGQRLATTTTQAEAPGLVARLDRSRGVTGVVDLPQLHSGGQSYLEALVGTCADLARVSERVHGCRDGEPMWIGPGPYDDVSPTISWVAGDEDGPVVATLPSDMAAMGNTRDSDLLAPLYADVLLPPAAVPDLPPATAHTLLVTGPPGRDLADRLRLDGYSTSVDLEEYDFVTSLRAIVWTIAAIVLGVGLLSLLVATIDRTLQRRREVVGLQLVGLGPGVLRRAQLIETGLPVTLGALLSIGLGALAGATFLTLTEYTPLPWHQTWGLMGAASLGCVVVAGIAVATSTPRLRPEEIRAE